MINPKETIPTFIQIDSIRVVPTDISKHGSISHKVTDVWVYYESQLLGAFELPAKIPVLTTERGQLQVVAGIWDNGLSGTRAKYPFYMVDTFTFNASPTKTISHIPTFRYRTTDTPLIKYFIEDFEQGNGFSKFSGDTNIIRTSLPEEVYEEDWSGKITLDTNSRSCSCITNNPYSIPPNKQAYLELNYKSEVPLFLRTRILYQGDYLIFDVIGLKARDTWTKMYINVSGFAASYQNGKFQYILDANLATGQNTAKVLIDNFKLIYFN